MSIIRAYHAGHTEAIEQFIHYGYGIRESPSRNNWLGAGIYFWDNDPRRAERWQVQYGRGCILECEIETELLIDMLIDDQRSQDFFALAQPYLEKLKLKNDRSQEYFGLDGEIINQVRPTLQARGYCGIRMAFCLGQPLAAEGNLFPNQHIQVCLWDISTIRNPRKYIPGLLE